MRTFIIALIALIVGGLLGGFAALGFGAGAGILVGAQAGACLALETAKDSGFLTAGDIDTILRETVARIRAEAPDDVDQETTPLVRSEADCAAVVAKLRGDGAS